MFLSGTAGFACFGLYLWLIRFTRPIHINIITKASIASLLSTISLPFFCRYPLLIARCAKGLARLSSCSSSSSISSKSWGSIVFLSIPRSATATKARAAHRKITVPIKSDHSSKSGGVIFLGGEGLGGIAFVGGLGFSCLGALTLSVEASFLGLPGRLAGGISFSGA